MHISSTELMKDESIRENTKWSLFDEIYQLSILTFFAILGVLARKGLIVLTTYEGSYLGGVIWANFTACVVMGMTIQSDKVWNYQTKQQIPLYVGITTGFCGTLSSFSSLTLEAFVKSANVPVGHHVEYKNGAYGIMECASVMISQISVSIAGLHFGKHLVKQFDPFIKSLKLVQNLIAILGILLWIVVICLISIKNWRSWIFACIVSPISCWIRYYTSKKLNPLIKTFPLGTFTVNITSSTILAILTILNRGRTSHGRIVNSLLSCHLITGLEDGFCGTLSTVSTFVVELYNIKSPQSYRYGIISLSISFCLVLIILGSYNWTKGLLDPVCT